MANRFLSNIKINDAYTFPASDGSNGQVIVTDGAGNLTFANPATSSSASIIYRDNFTGDGSTTVFYLQNSLSDEDQTQIYIDGVYQEKGTYSLSNNAITFTTAPPNGDSVEVISISGINVGPTTIYQDNFTGDGTTTDFTLAQAVNDEVKTMVYFNGVYQFKGTYSLNGTLMSFDTAPTNGVDIEVISIASAAAADYNQKMLFYGKASEAISKGEAIMLGGQEGDHFLLAKATQAAIAANHEYFLGLASQDLAQGEFGYVTEFGKIIEIDTSGYTAGDVLWFDAGGSTAGALTTTEPAAPLAKIQVAAVIRSHQNEGVLFIRPTWYHELSELHDVNVTSVADRDLLVWNSTDGYWENSKTVDTLSGNTFTATTLAGTLSTAAQPNVTSVGTLSSLAVSGNLTVDTNTLYVDSANNRIGIGTQIDSGELITAYGSSEAAMVFQNTNSGTGTSQGLYIGTLNAENYLWTFEDQPLIFGANNEEKARIDSSGNVGIGGAVITDVHLLNIQGSSAAKNIGVILNDTNTSRIYSISNGGNALKFYDYTANSERLRIDSSGNIGINETSPSAKLHINHNNSTIAFTYGNSVPNNPLHTAFYGGWSGIGMDQTTAGIRIAGDINGNNPLVDIGYYTNGTVSHANWNSDFIVRKGGTVGISTTSPIRKLHVDGGSISTDTPTLRISSTDSSGTNKFGIEFYSNNGADVRGKLLADNNGRVYIDDNGGGGVVLQANGGSGNVGIATTSPKNKLHVNGSLQVGYVDALNDAMVFSWGGASTSGKIQTYSSSALLLNPEGNNVGIGITGAPSAKLHVAGTAFLSDDVYVGDSSSNLLFATYAAIGGAYSGSFGWNSLQLGNNGGNFIMAGNNAAGGTLSIYTNVSSRYRYGVDTNIVGAFSTHFDAAGNVGINRTSLSQKLHVAGNIKIDGANHGNVANLIMTRTDASWRIANETDFRIYSGGGDTDAAGNLRMQINSAGNASFTGTVSVGSTVLASSYVSTPNIYSKLGAWYNASTAGKTVGPSGTAVLTIDGGGNINIADIDIRVSFTGNGALNSHFHYYHVCRDTSNASYTPGINQYYNESVGSFQVSTSDFAISYSGDDIIITYTNQASGTNTINFYVKGLWNSISLA